jgi:hypothetical protein
MSLKSFTSVKVDKEAYEQFKELSQVKKFYLQDLVNRSLHLFTKDSSFRDQIYNYQVPVLSEESQSTILPSTITQPSS